jgi:hypothetical protein
MPADGCFNHAGPSIGGSVVQVNRRYRAAIKGSVDEIANKTAKPALRHFRLFGVTSITHEFI